MSNFEHILGKLNAFIKKYYTKMLIKGVLLFLTLGLLVFLLVTSVEYALWLSPTVRLFLFIGFLLTVLFLGYHYIITPLTYLFKIRKGIDEKEASKIIGKHFPKIGDKLLNLLELSTSQEKSDLLLASIEQRSQKLSPLPFTDAINFKDGFRNARYLAIPISILGLVWLFGNIGDFFNSYNRVVNYDVAYEPPAPFRFLLENENLKVLEDAPLTISVNTIGNLMPEAVTLELDDETMIMQRSAGGQHSITIEPPIQNFSFRFKANDVTSRSYEVEVTKVPAIVDFEMLLNFPRYLNTKNRVVTGTGNVTVPEGTNVTWQIQGLNTDRIELITKDTITAFQGENNQFEYSKLVFSGMEYELTTSNTGVANYERLGYRLNVVKDEMPRIKVEEARDSLQPNELYFSGSVSDDHLVKSVSMTYYDVDKPDATRSIELLKPNDAVAQFYYTFPSGIEVERGKVYEIYFEVADNDGLRGGKIAKSGTFRTAVLNDNQLKDSRLNSQESLINDLNKGLKQLDEQNDVLDKINQEQKQQEGALEYNDKQRIKQFLNKQQQQEALMEKFSKELKESLNKENKNDALNELLKERLERQQLAAKKNQKLLEQLEKVADKIEKEDLKKRLEELAKSQSSGKRNLEQLLELTKRYYVTEKAAQLGQKLEELAKDQEVLSEQKIGEGFSEEQQERLNKKFEEISNELDELKGDNRALRKPMSLDYNKNEQESIKKDQEDALEEINKHQGAEQSDSQEEGQKQMQNKTSQKQKSAAQKMQELSNKLQESMSGAGGSSGAVEDAEMLRQILDNLITFSFKQEGLLDKVEGNSIEISEFSTTVKQQKELRELFEHVDDSLFALSLRRAELSEFVNEQITEVYYNVDKSLESIADNQMYQAASYQQYVLSASNALADFLANTLDNMQQSMMSGQGQGQGQGFQLPDIIKKQGELQEKMQGGENPGQEGSQSQGQSGQEGSEGEGQKGKKGNQSGEGNSGNNSEREQGENGQEGKNGKQGEGGKEGEGKNGRKGNQGDNGGDGQGNGLSESQLKEIYEIYQEQQTLRKALEEQLKNIINAEERDLAKKLAIQMEQFENELLENGITKRTVDRMNSIQHQLLKLENAALKQGKKNQRESNTKQQDYTTPILTKPELLKTKTNSIEILNRQGLPLRPNYQDRVKEYFGNGN